MSSLQKGGGWAALTSAAAYICGFALFLGLLDSSAYVGPLRKLVFLTENQHIIFLAFVALYILTGVALVVLVVALHARLRHGSAMLMPVATPFGLIWAGLVLASGMVGIVGMEAVIALAETDPERSATLWQTIAVVQDALGGGVELVGGLWVLLVSLAALRANALPRPLCWLGIAIGGVGILTTVPALKDMAVVFGLGLILWFAWLGVVMIRVPAPEAEADI